MEMWAFIIGCVGGIFVGIVGYREYYRWSLKRGHEILKDVDKLSKESKEVLDHVQQK